MISRLSRLWYIDTMLFGVSWSRLVRRRQSMSNDEKVIKAIKRIVKRHRVLSTREITNELCREIDDLDEDYECSAKTDKLLDEAYQAYIDDVDHKWMVLHTTPLRDLLYEYDVVLDDLQLIQVLVHVNRYISNCIR